MDNTTSAPYKVTLKELRNIAKNTYTSTNLNLNNTDRYIATMRVQTLLTNAGVPDHLQPAAAAEAEFRVAFPQETEKNITAMNKGRRLLRIVKEQQLDREPWPEHLMR